MYQPMLFIHWKQIRGAFIPLVIAAFGLPLASVQGLGPGPGGEAEFAAYQALMSAQAWLPMFPLLAGAIGITLALTAWNWDHQLHHVYALSLPVSRWRYAILKMGAGAVLSLVPATAFWIGTHVATASIVIPPGLEAYPNALALRFFLGILLSYATMFAMASGTVRTAVVIVSLITAFFVVGGALNGFLAAYFDTFKEVNVVQAVVDVFVSRNGPFEVFSGSWSLIDV